MGDGFDIKIAPQLGLHTKCQLNSSKNVVTTHLPPRYSPFPRGRPLGGLGRFDIKNHTEIRFAYLYSSKNVVTTHLPPKQSPPGGPPSPGGRGDLTPKK